MWTNAIFHWQIFVKNRHWPIVSKNLPMENGIIKGQNGNFHVFYCWEAVVSLLKRYTEWFLVDCTVHRQGHQKKLVGCRFFSSHFGDLQSVCSFSDSFFFVRERLRNNERSRRRCGQWANHFRMKWFHENILRFILDDWAGFSTIRRHIFRFKSNLVTATIVHTIRSIRKEKNRKLSVSFTSAQHNTKKVSCLLISC